MSPGLPPLPPAAVTLGARAGDWRTAVRLAARALARAGLARPGVAADMIRMVEENGPYLVVADGVALAHARPGPRILGDGLSIVVLARPVAFGHAHHDPVRVVVGLAATSPAEQLAAVAAVANAFNDPGLVGRLTAATDAAEVVAILR